MIVVAIVGMLASIAVPSWRSARRTARITKAANDLRIFGEAFQQYCMDRGKYPIDTHTTLPPGMEGYIEQTDWDDYAMGGHFNWEGPTWGEGGPYDYAGISLFGADVSTDEMLELDGILDDGNLATGIFRLTPNSRYTYIIEEQ